MASLADTNNAAVDRVNIATEQYLQDLQDQQRAGAATATAQGDSIDSQGAAITALTTRVTTLEGEVKGRLLAAPTLLTGSGAGALPAGTCMVRLRMIGQGAGGGGARDIGAGAAAAAGGSSGDDLELWIGSPGVPLSTLAYSWAMGATGGAGGVAAGGTGTNGQDSTATINATVYSASGGGGGLGMNTTAGNGNTNPATPSGTTTSSGTHGFTPGGIGVVVGGSMWFSGAGGGAEQWGAGGPSVGGSTAGANASGFGAGGGGAATAGGSGNRAGGNGSPGAAWIEAYS